MRSGHSLGNGLHRQRPTRSRGGNIPSLSLGLGLCGLSNLPEHRVLISNSLPPVPLRALHFEFGAATVCGWRRALRRFCIVILTSGRPTVLCC